MGDSRVQIGVAADNVLDGTAPPELERQLLEARLQSELGRKTSQLVSETEIARDWELHGFRDVGIPAAAVMEPIVGVLEILGGVLLVRCMLI